MDRLDIRETDQDLPGEVGLCAAGGGGGGSSFGRLGFCRGMPTSPIVWFRRVVGPKSDVFGSPERYPFDGN